MVGFDSVHGRYHRHYLGKVTEVKVESFEQMEALFEEEWSRLAKEVCGAED